MEGRWGAVRKCLAGKLTFGQRPEGGEGGRAAAFIHLGEQCSEQREQQAQNLEAGRLLQVGEREQSMSLVAQAGRGCHGDGETLSGAGGLALNPVPLGGSQLPSSPEKVPRREEELF